MNCKKLKIIMVSILCLWVVPRIFARNKTVIDLMKVKKPYYTWASEIEMSYFIPSGFYGDYLNPAPFINFKLRFNPSLIDHFLIDLDLGYAFSNLKDNHQTKYSILPVGFSFNYFYPLDAEKFYISAFLGSGYYFMKIGDASYQNLYVKAGAGFHYQATPNLLLALKGSYHNFYDQQDSITGYAASLAFTYSFGTPLSEKDIKIKEFSADRVFAALYTSYYEKAIGRLKLQNTSSGPLKEVKASLYLKNYMDNQTYSLVEKKVVAKNQVVSIPIYAFLNENIKNLHEDTQTTAVLEIDYKKADGKQYKKRDLVKLILKGVNALTWDNLDKLGSFISYKNKQIIRFARAALNTKVNSKIDVNTTLVQMVKIVQAVKDAGIKYVSDPSSYRQYSSAKVDYIQYPVQTLMLKTGDCDDLTVLLTSLLESVGIQTAFVSVPGHIFMMARANDVSDTVRVVHHRGGKWIPIEATVIDKGFAYAWMQGYRNYTAYKNREIKTVQHVTSKYAPLLPKWDETFRIKLSASYVKETQDQLKILSKMLIDDPKKVDMKQPLKKINSQGIKLAKAGQIEKAEAVFKKCIQKNADYKSPYYNLIVLYWLNKQYNKAVKMFEDFNKKYKKDSKAHFLISKVYLDMGQVKKSNYHYQISVKPAEKMNEEQEKNIKANPDNNWVE